MNFYGGKIELKPTEELKVSISPIGCACNLLIMEIDVGCCPGLQHTFVYMQYRGRPLQVLGKFSSPSFRKNW